MFSSSFPAEHQCAAPRAADNVIYPHVKENYSDGQFQEFKCEPGYTSDSGRIKCDNGQWEKPDCKRNLILSVRLYIDLIVSSLFCWLVCL